jgi:hypothetical protein
MMRFGNTGAPRRVQVAPAVAEPFTADRFGRARGLDRTAGRADQGIAQRGLDRSRERWTGHRDGRGLLRFLRVHRGGGITSMVYLPEEAVLMRPRRFGEVRRHRPRLVLGPKTSRRWRFPN